MRQVKSKALLSAGVSALVLTLVSGVAWAQEAADKTTDAAATSDQATDKQSADKAQADNTLVIVTARRKALATAIEIKKNSDTIVDSVVADEAGQLPDTSITEVLQRVSGVTMSRFTTSNGETPSFQIEGSGLSVRGLPYNSSTLNGRQAFSANGANSLSWGDVTPELMAGVDVYKASRADFIEGGTSSIDLRTHMPFDYKKPEMDISLGASYGDMIKKVSPDASMLLTRRFDTKVGEMGLLFDVAHSEYYSADSDVQMGPYQAENDPNRDSSPGANDGWALVPTGYSWSQNKHKRDRDGFYAAFQWRPSDDLTLSSTLFYSKYSNFDHSYSGGWSNNPTATFENIPSSDSVFDSNGAMQSGSLSIGGTGASTPIFGFGGNNFLYEYYDPTDPNYAWISQYLGGYQTELNADCRTQYGSLDVSTPNVDWGKWDQPGMFYCQEQAGANTPKSLNLGGSASAGKGGSSTMDFSQSFVWRPNDRLRVRGALQYVYSNTKSQSMYASITQSDPSLSSASFNADKGIPYIGGFDATALANTDTAYFSSFSWHGSDNKGISGAANLDVDYEFGDDHFFKEISFGVRAADRQERDNFLGSYWAPISEDWVGYNYPSGATPPAGVGYRAYLTGQFANGVVSPSDYQLYSFPNYFNGKVASPGSVLVPNVALLESFNWQHFAAMSADVNVPDSNGDTKTIQEFGDSYFSNTTGITETNIQNRAVYLETRFGGDGFGFVPAFSGNFGVRVVNAVMRGNGNLVVKGGNAFYLSQADAYAAAFGGTPQGDLYQVADSATPRYKKYGFTRVLPSFNIKFDVTPQLILRFAASKAMSPPNLGDIKAGGNVTANITSVDPSGSYNYLSSVYSQNGAGSNMKPVMFDDADASLEWYPKNGVYAYLDLFAKQIKDQDLFSSYYQTQPTTLVDVSTGEQSTVDLPWFFVQNKTAAKAAQIRGFEMGGRKFFDNLPAPFNGFGVSGNVTYVDSQNPAALANSVVGPFAPVGNTKNVDPNQSSDFGKMPYFGMSKWSYNLELYYSKGPLNARIAYNWHSKQLMSTSSNPLSYIGTGSADGTVCTACLDERNGGNTWELVPMWSDDAGYLDFSIDYKINARMSFGFQANNLTNTLSKTLQEPLPGVFERLDTYQSDRRMNVYLRMHF